MQAVGERYETSGDTVIAYCPIAWLSLVTVGQAGMLPIHPAPCPAFSSSRQAALLLTHLVLFWLV